MLRATTTLFACLAFLVSLTAAAPLFAADSPYSQAEQKLFLDDHLHNLKRSETLHYDFKKTGSMEEGFDDTVQLSVKPSDGGKHKAVDVLYLTGNRRLSLPAVDDPQGNPVILYFLEQDVRDMHRRTGGTESYFRKRIRLALAEAAEVRTVTLKFAGKDVAGNEVRIRPYLNDPMKAKFANFENKAYVFTLSDQVPGGVYQLRTRLDDSTPAGDASKGAKPPLMEEILTFSKLDH